MPTRRDVLKLPALTALCLVVPARAQSRVRVVATFSILGDLVKQVGGDRVEVVTLVGPDGDVHVYSPTPADAKALGAARAIFVNGLGLEGWIARLIAVSGGRAPVIVASTGVKARDVADKRDPSRMVPDPHAWQSIANAGIYVGNIRDALRAADPDGSGTYDDNAKAYLGKLDALESEVKAAIAKIPADRRKIITTHGSFGYFGDAYGMEFIAPEGLSTDADPSAKDVAKVIVQIKREHIPAVFIENIYDPRLIERIAEESGAKIGGTLYSDALSPPNGPAATYIAMMRHNARALVDALAP
jgi:zinc/manganese transport system substrate-binding protein